MNTLFTNFAKCVNNVSDLRMVIEMDNNPRSDNYWLVDFDDPSHKNNEYYGNGTVVQFYNIESDESFEYATYEEGWTKLKELAAKATKVYVEGY